MELQGNGDFIGYVPAEDENEIIFQDYVPAQSVADDIRNGFNRNASASIEQNYPTAGKAIQAGETATASMEGNWLTNMVRGAGEMVAALPYAGGKAFGRTMDYVEKGLNLALPGDPFKADWEESFEKDLQETEMGRAIKSAGEKAPLFSDFTADVPAMFSLNVAGTAVAGKALAGLGKVVMATEAENGLVGLLSTKFSQYAPKMKDVLKNSSMFRGIVNPRTIGEAELAGSWGRYAGSWIGATLENFAGDMAASPTWLFKDRPGDENYQQKYGLIATNFGWNAVFSVGTPLWLSRKFNLNRIAKGGEDTRVLRETIGQLENAGEHSINMTTPISAPKLDAARDMKLFHTFTMNLIDEAQKVGWDKIFEKSPQVEQLIRANKMLDAKIKKLFKWGDDVDLSLDMNKMIKAMKGDSPKAVEAYGKTTWARLSDLLGQDVYQDFVILNPNNITITGNPTKLKGQAKTLNRLVENGWIAREGKNGWVVTPSGAEHGVQIFNPTNTKENLRIVKLHERRAGRDLSDIIATRIAAEKGDLVKHAVEVMPDGKGNFILTDMNIVTSNPEFQGGISDGLAEVAKQLGKGDTKKIGVRALFQPLARAMRYNPEGQAIIDLGKKANLNSIHLEQKAADMMPTWHKAIADKNTAGFDEFFKLYSPMRNKGWLVENIILDTDGNWKAVLDANHKFNQEMLIKNYGYTEQQIAEAIKNKTPIYMPSMMDSGGVAAIADGTVGAELLKEWKNLQEHLYHAFEHSKLINDTGRSYRKYHTQVVNESSERLWRWFYTNAANQPDIGGVYLTKQDAEKELMEFIRKNKELGLHIDTTQVIQGKEGVEMMAKYNARIREYDRLWPGATEGTPRGHFQGNLYDQGVEAGVEIYQGVLSEVRGAYRENLKASYSKMMENLGLTSREATEEYLNMMLGKPAKAPIVQTIDNAADQIIDYVHNTIRDWREIKEETLWKAAPRQLRDRGRNWFNQQAKNISLAMYSAGNLSAATVNMVSLIQNLPMAMEWYNKFPNETVEQWVLRTGLKVAGKEAPEIVSNTAIGIGFLKNMTKPEYVDELYKAAARTGVLTDELKELKFALDPLAKANQGKVTKFMEAVSKPVFKTEEWSRLAAFGVGWELAKRRFKLPENLCERFAARFVDTAMGGYSLFDRPGITNSMMMKHVTMFTTYTGNLLTRAFDMWEGGAKGALARSNLMSAIMFGPKTTPLVKQWIEAHGYEDDVLLSSVADMGLSAYTGLVLNGMLDFDATDLTRGFQRPLAISAVQDVAAMMQDVIKDIAASGQINMQYVMEAAATRFPAVVVRRAAQGALGGKYTMNHSQITEEKAALMEDILQRARLLAGYGSAQERLFGNMERFKEQKNIAKAEAMKQLRMSMKAWERSGGSPDQLFERVFNIYGGDIKQATALFTEVMTQAKSGQQTRFLMDLMKTDKYDSVIEFMLNAMTQGENDGVIKD